MPRSGTTLLATILNASPDLAISPETDYFPNFWRPCERRHCLSTPPGQRAFVRHWLASPGVSRLSLPRHVLENIRSVLSSQMPDHAAILGTTLAGYASLRRKIRWGEKTPAHVYYVSIIQTMFPTAKIVHIVRDPRDISLSLQKVPWNTGNLVQHIRDWKRCISIDVYDFDRYQLVRYEDILTQPEPSVKVIADFLGIRYTSDMLHPERGRDRVFDGTEEPWKAKASRALDPHNAHKWRRLMGDADRRLVATLAGPELVELRYEANSRRSNLKDLLYRWFRTSQNALFVSIHYAWRAWARLNRALRKSRAEWR